MIYNEKYEKLSREELQQVQIERLQSTLNRVYRNVAFYKQAFDRHKVDIERIKDVKALRELPFTRKEDLRLAYPYDMFAMPLRDIVRIHATSGTTGKPIIVGYTKNDLRNWTECTARLLTAAGITAHDVVQIAFHYSLFTGGFGFHQGAEKIGASVIPSSSSSSLEKQVTIMKDFKTTVLICTPRYALTIAALLEELGMHPERLQLRLGLFGGEPWTEGLRHQLEERLHIATIDSYGLTEVMGPGVAGECEARNGLHINEDHFIVEAVHPETLEPVEPGTDGELVFTTITKEGFPVIRYRTGDISSIDERPCECGRTFVRMRRVAGRTDDLIFFRGLKVFPSQIEESLIKVEGASSNFEIILETVRDEDTMEIRVEVSETLPGMDELKTLEHLRASITRRISADLDLEAKVTLAETRSLGGRPLGKVHRVIDRRTK